MNKACKPEKYFVGILSAVCISAVLSFAPVYAAYNGATLSGVEINPVENGSYQIVVKTDKSVPFEKQVTADNKIVLDLKNIKPANFVNTIYNNASSVDHVIIQPVSDNQVRIFLQGENISSSNVTLDTNGGSLNLLDQNTPPVPQTNVQNTGADNQSLNTQDAPQQETQKSEDVVYLNRPIDSFKPVANYDVYEDESSEADVQAEESSSGILQSVMGKISLNKIFNSSTFDWLLRFLMLGLLIFGGIKLLKPKKKNVKIDLTNNVKMKELDLYRSLQNKRGLIGTGLGSSSKVYSEISKKPGYGSFSQYGMKEYQNSDKPRLNPPSSSPVLKTGRTVTPLKNNTPLKTLNKPETRIPATNRPLSTNKVTKTDINNAKVNIDGMKFLESMAQIYEKSGRADLAQGLQTSILKAKTTKTSKAV